MKLFVKNLAKTEGINISIRALEKKIISIYYTPSPTL
jgi:hypothetical protein